MARTSQRETATKTIKLEGQPDERRIATPRSDLVVVKIGGRPLKPQLSSDERAPDLVVRLVKAIAKTGINRDSVFRPESGRKIYAYSVSSKHPDKIVREDAAGRRTLGRLVGGKFRPDRSRRPQ